MDVRIKKVLVLFLAGTVALCMFGAVSVQGKKTVYAGDEIYERAHEAVFYVRALNEDSSLRAAGTGFFITPDGYALTAAHVIKDSFSVNVETESGDTYKNVEIVYSDTTVDLAVLKLTETKADFSYVPPAETPPSYGTVIYAIGYPLKTTKMIVNGIVSTPESQINGNEQMLMTVPLSNGMSGGLIVDEYGYAVGIASGTLRTMSDISISPTTVQLQKIIKKTITEG